MLPRLHCWHLVSDMTLGDAKVYFGGCDGCYRGLLSLCSVGMYGPGLLGGQHVLTDGQLCGDGGRCKSSREASDQKRTSVGKNGPCCFPGLRGLAESGLLVQSFYSAVVTSHKHVD